MSTKHRNAGGPFTIFNPGLGVTGSLKIEADAPDKRALDVSGSMSIMPKYQIGQGLHADFRHMLEIAQENQGATTPQGIAIFGANGLTRNGDGYGSLGIYSGSSTDHREFIISSGIHGAYSSAHTNLSDLVFITSGTDNETRRVKITQDPTLQVTGSLDVTGDVAIQEHVIAELSTPGASISTTSDAYTFNCPYDISIERLDLYLSTPCSALGSVTVEVEGSALNGSSPLTIVSATLSGLADYKASSTTIANGSRASDSRVTFKITTTDGTARGLRANLRYRRRL